MLSAFLISPTAIVPKTLLLMAYRGEYRLIPHLKAAFLAFCFLCVLRASEAKLFYPSSDQSINEVYASQLWYNGYWKHVRTAELRLTPGHGEIGSKLGPHFRQRYYAIEIRSISAPESSCDANDNFTLATPPFDAFDHV